MKSCQMFRMHGDESNGAFFSLVRDYDLVFTKSVDLNLVIRRKEDVDSLYGNILLHKEFDEGYVLYSILSIIIDKRLVKQDYLEMSVFQPLENILVVNNNGKDVYLLSEEERKCFVSDLPNQLAKDLASYLMEDFKLKENAPE